MQLIQLLRTQLAFGIVNPMYYAPTLMHYLFYKYKAL